MRGRCVQETLCKLDDDLTYAEMKVSLMTIADVSDRWLQLSVSQGGRKKKEGGYAERHHASFALTKASHVQPIGQVVAETNVAAAAAGGAKDRR